MLMHAQTDNLMRGHADKKRTCGRIQKTIMYSIDKSPYRLDLLFRTSGGIRILHRFEPARPMKHATANRIEDGCREGWRQFLAHRLEGCRHTVGQLRHDFLGHSGRDSDRFTCLNEMSRRNRFDDVVPVPACSKRHFHVVMTHLARIDGRLRRHHIIERCHSKSSARTEKDAEVLAVTICSA